MRLKSAAALLIMVSLISAGLSGWMVYRFTQPSPIVSDSAPATRADEAAPATGERRNALIPGAVSPSAEGGATAPDDTPGVRPGADPEGAPAKPTPVPSAPAPVPSAVLLRLTEAEATAKVAEALANGEFPLAFENPQVQLRNDRVRATANVDIGGFGVPATVQARVDVVQGKPKVTVERIDFAGIAPPQAIRDQLSDIVEQELDPSRFQDLPIVFEEITVADGVMTVKGHAIR